MLCTAKNLWFCKCNESILVPEKSIRGKKKISIILSLFFIGSQIWRCAEFPTLIFFITYHYNDTHITKQFKLNANAPRFDYLCTCFFFNLSEEKSFCGLSDTCLKLNWKGSPPSFRLRYQMGLVYRLKALFFLLFKMAFRYRKFIITQCAWECETILTLFTSALFFGTRLHLWLKKTMALSYCFCFTCRRFFLMWEYNYTSHKNMFYKKK